MELNDFVAKFAEQFEETVISSFSKDTRFHDLDEWSSLTGLSVLAMIADEFEIQIKAEEMRKMVTIEDLYNLINSKL